MAPKKRPSTGADGPARRSPRVSTASSSAPAAASPSTKSGKPASRSKEVNGAEEEPAPKKAKVTALAVGDIIPAGVKLQNEQDEEVDVKDLVAEKGAVFFIYPKAATPGCTTQACGFRDIYSEIVDVGFQVFGLSMDGPNAQKKWQAKVRLLVSNAGKRADICDVGDTQQELQYHLLCDPKQHLIKLFGASKSASSVQRSHYVVAKGGKLVDVKSPASPKEGPGQALAFIKSLA